MNVLQKKKPNSNEGMFSSPDGRSYLIPFILVSVLFMLWGFCNGLIDVMDKHFQVELKLTLAQSAWVQFAHYLGYFLMALPAAWIAGKLGYKGGIIAGLLMVSIGGFWFIPATQIATFPAFLLGVCLIASGLTFLETVANPYTTVLGPKRYSATRITLSQSCNGVGWVFGPAVGAIFFYGKDESGQSTGSETLWIPYAAIGVFVLVLAVIFFFVKLPDVTTEDEFSAEDDAGDSGGKAPMRSLGMAFLWVNIVVLATSIAMIVSAIVAIPSIGARIGFNENYAFLVSAGVLILIGTYLFITKRNRITVHSIWSYPHFSGATLAQFLYVAAQSGIFAYFINYMTSQTPSVPASWQTGMFTQWFEMHGDNHLGFSDKGASNLASLGFVCFLAGRFIGAGLLKKFSAHKVLSVFAVAASICCLLIFLKLGWVSAAALFLTYFFMSIMFPTIFSLGIYGFGSRAKRASSFIVMAIMGGAIMPKLMGHVGDLHDMSYAFIVPLACFAYVTFYALSWSRLSFSDDIPGVKTKGH